MQASVDLVGNVAVPTVVEVVAASSGKTMLHCSRGSSSLWRATLSGRVAALAANTIYAVALTEQGDMLWMSSSGLHLHPPFCSALHSLGVRCRAMAMRGRFTSATTSDGSDYEHRQTVAGYYQRSAAARDRLRQLFRVDLVAIIIATVIVLNPLLSAPAEHISVLSVAMAVVVVQFLSWIAVFKTRSAAWVEVAAMGSLLSSGAELFYGHRSDTLGPKVSCALLGIVHLAIGVVCLQLGRAFAQAAVRPA